MTVMIPNMEIEIVGFDSIYADDFARLNYKWIDKYFQIEQHDRELLDHPYEQIIKPGGEIFFALSDRIAAGTAAMIRFDEETFELSKMAVAPEFQGRGIANMLMDACIQFAIARRASKIFLETNSKLAAAPALYRKYGFKDAPLDPNSQYSRANIRMELAISSSDM